MNKLTKASHVTSAVISGMPKSKNKTLDRSDARFHSRKSQKKHSGHRSGSRNHPEATNKKTPIAVTKDPRIGSKVTISLLVASDAKTKPVVVKKRITAAEELSQLESDERLDRLLDCLDNGDTLHWQDQAYVDSALCRIDILMKKLGIDRDDADQQNKQEDILRLLQCTNPKAIL